MSGAQYGAWPANGSSSSLGQAARASGSRFVPHDFRYNSRVAVALLPSLAVLAGYGGNAVSAALAVGLMSTYILDALRYKEGAFMASWLTMGAANLAMIFSTLLIKSEASIPLTLLIFMLNGLTLFLTGLWASLQFRFVQLQYPGVVIAFEKMLIAGCLPVTAAVQTWGMVSGVGMSNACFFMAALLCALYYFFALPLPSSFHLGAKPRVATGGAKPKTHTLQDSADGFAAFVLVTTLPVAAYLATHWAVLFQWVHLWSLLLLASGPLVFVASLKDGLWWLGDGRAVNALRRLLLLVSLAVFLAALEERVVFHSFNQYIRLTAPWNYVAVTACMYGVAALVLLHFSGSLGEEMEGMLVGPLLMLSAAVGALAAGLPLWMLPAPLLAASGLAMFYDTLSLRDYCLFVLGAVTTGGWFVWNHFWFLDIQLEGAHLQTLSAVLVAALAASAFVPGLLYSEAPRGLLGGALLAQAALLCWLEERLYAGDHREVTHGLHSMYPPWLVAATSALGLVAARHLHGAAVLGHVPAYLLQCAYAAKLSMLFLPEARLMVPVLGMLLAASPPLLLHGVGGERRAELEHPGRERRRRLQPWQGLALATAVVLSVVAARFAVFDIARSVLDRRPSEALVAGLLVACMALGCLPLVQRYYPHSLAAKRALLLAAALAALLVLLRPPLPIRGGAECPRGLPLGLCPRLWDAGHVPQHEVDDVAVWGDGLRRRTHWPLWLMLGAAFLGLSAMTQPGGGGPLGPLLQAGQAAGAAALMAAYLALEFFPALPMLQVIILVTALVAALFLVLLQLPVPGGGTIMPALAASWLVGLPLALLVASTVQLPELPEAAERLLSDSERELDEERRDALLAAVMAVYAAESLLLAFALKLRVASALAGQRGPRPSAPAAAAALGLDDGSFHRAASFLGQCMPAFVQEPGGSRPALKGAGGMALQRLAQDGLSWVPTLCNLVALLCFGLCVTLNFKITDGEPVAILLLAPILLLLAQDPLLLRWLEDRRRYAPPCAAVTAYLVAAAGVQLVHDLGLGVGGLSAWAAWFLARHVVMLLATLPCQLILLTWLWRLHFQPPVALLLAAAPLNLIVLWLADMDELRISAGVALAAAAAQLLAAQQSSQKMGRALV